MTGSCFFVETDDVRFLEDCGMHQGGREAHERNFNAWPFDPATIDFVLLTHAHIDHSGLIPRLCAMGFKGRIHTTTATADLLSVMLLDSAFIQDLDRPECAIVIIGYQAVGTLGRRLVDGEKRVRLFGEDVRVRAGIHTIGGLSAHADQAALLGWLKGFEVAPRRTFVVHGEAETACGFADRVAEELGWSVEAPAPGTRVDL